MKILSLFDWISCARVALDRAWISVETYYASEVDKYAIQIAQKNYPNTIQLGDVRSVTKDMVWEIDLLIGGSPCQDLSVAKKDRKGLDGEKSGLFWEYVRILKEVNPKWFILENVASMSKESRDTISDVLGIEPIMIDAALVSAQTRKRLFWTNIPRVMLPYDRNISLQDILERNVEEKYYVNITDKYWYKWLVDINKKAKTLTASSHKWYGNDWVTIIKLWHLNSWGQGDRIYSAEWKSVTLSANWWWIWAKTWLYYIQQQARWFNKWNTFAEKSPTITSNARQENNKLVCDWNVRKLTPIECERLQWLPDNYTDGISNTQRYKCLGNAFNVDVVAHILSFIPKQPW